MSEHWAVTVARDGEEILTIESNCVSGRDLDEEDCRVIRLAAQNLWSFVGSDEPRLFGVDGGALGDAPEESKPATPKEQAEGAAPALRGPQEPEG